MQFNAFHRNSSVRVRACLSAETKSGVNDENAEQHPRQCGQREEYFLTDDENRRLEYLKPQTKKGFIPRWMKLR